MENCYGNWRDVPLGREAINPKTERTENPISRREALKTQEDFMKISTESIEGFDSMSPEEKITALLDLDVPDPVDLSGYVKKDVFDAKATEAAKLSKELREHKSSEENAKADADKSMQELQEKYNELLKSSTIANHTARYLALPGYDENLARETAEALFAGDMDKVFQNQQKANANHEKELKAALLKEEGKLPGAGGSGGQEPEEVAFARMLGKKKAESNKQNGLDRFII